MKKILLPTDFSENAYNAIEYAMHLFENEDCRFYLFHSYIPVIFDNAYFNKMPDSYLLEDTHKESRLRDLKKVKTRILFQFPDLKGNIELLTSFNSLQKGIKEVVKKYDVDVVIMGTQGATGAVGVLFGSNTTQALKDLRCPLIAVPSHYAFKKPSQILFPTDFGSVLNENHLQLISYLSHKYKTSIKVLHVYYYGYDLDTKQKEKKNWLAEYFKDSDVEFVRKDNEEVVKAIENYIDSEPVDLVALVNNKHSFFDNLFFKPVIKHIGFNIKSPLLVIPAQFRENKKD